ALDISVSICRNCGKRIAEGRSGSFTQYIFRADICQCESPKPFKQAPFGSPNPTSHAVIFDDENEEELEFAPEKFPVERYKAIRQLGSGGSGTVYLARDRLLNKLVAVKLLIMLEPKQLIAFQEEARATSSLSHSFIVGLLDFGVTAGAVPYMVLDYVPGASLEEVLKERKRLDWQVCQKIFVQVCEALEFAHDHGILHRDITPQNIILHEVVDKKDEFAVRIIDFGIASAMRSDENEGSQKQEAVIGAPLYMSPDLARGLVYDSRSEVYCLACVLFEALSGNPPYVGETPLLTLNMHAEAEIPRLSELVENLSSDFDEVFFRALAKDPDDRMESIAEFRSCLMQRIFPHDKAP
ncbi:MAG: serine/threonine protein kinase, partial [Candidatus Obscuribacterales bacterium]|nr:serine/threonine protein kinase [Candidatus Obscuribacterales bacterium]